VLQNPLIDIAIGLTLMYLVLSLVCTIVNEFIATKLKLRSKSLAAGLQELLDDPIVRNAFYDHGMISGTSKALEMCGQVSLMGAVPASPATTVTAAPNVTQAAGPAAAAGAPATPTLPAAPTAETQPGQHPSYLSSETFVLALVGCLTGTRVAAGAQVPTFAETQAVIEKLAPSKIKSALVASLIVAEGDFEKFRKSLTTWFDDSMERLSGAYKRHLKLISIVVGFAVALAINADTFAVGYALWSNPALRGQMVAVADKTVHDGLTDAAKSRTSEADSQTPTFSDVSSAVKKANTTLRPMLPLGWSVEQWLEQGETSSAKPAAPRSQRLIVGSALLKVAGLFVTALALSLGAPFWFDVLSKVVNIRGAGVRPERSDRVRK
jgi:hypothetical protein